MESFMEKNVAIHTIMRARQYVYTFYEDCDIGKNVKIHFDNKMSVIEGTTDDDYGEILYIAVGNDEIVNTEYPLVKDVIACVVSTFHEGVGHGYQIMKMYHNENDLSKALCLNHFACKCSVNYQYGNNNESYFHQPKEMVAQYFGIKYAFDFLSKKFDEIEANKMICNYVNNRIEKNSEFIKFRSNRRYDNINDIMDEFKVSFYRCLLNNRKFTENSLRYPDSLGFYSREIGLKDIEKMKLMYAVNGMKQDFMLTAIYLMEEDKNDYLREIYPVLKDIPSFKEATKAKFLPSWIPINRKKYDLKNIDIISDDIDYER